MFERMSHQVAHILPAIYQHPFNKELFSGSLPKSTFDFYLRQDIYYLKKFYDAIKLVGGRLNDPDHRKHFKSFSKETRAFERSLHSGYVNNDGAFKLFEKKKGIIELTPATHNYTQHLLHTAAEEPVEVAVASLVPCFLVYNKLGVHMSVSSPPHKPNPYLEWIASYSSPEFTASTDTIIRILNELASQVTDAEVELKMLQVFVKSVKYELNFWQDCYVLAKPNAEKMCYNSRQLTQ